jgi:predicted ATP-grasp superfamily ATP-dependent carboligase
LPVLLLGGLNLIRPLGMAGIPVIVAAPEVTPAMMSRYCKGRLVLPPLGRREAVLQSLVRAGERLAREHGAPVPLFYGDDDYLGIVQEFRAELEPYFRLLLNEPALARALLDKSLFQALAEARGLPVPRRLELETLEAFEGQVLVKPKSKAGWDDSIVHWQLFSHAGKAGIFASGRAALAQPAVRELADKLAFQEYIPGGDDAIWSFHGFATEESRLLGWFIGRKIRTYPALTGDSSYLRLAHDDALAELGRDVVARLGLKGAFKIDFKKSAATGEFHVFEINARFNLWHYLGAASRVNLPRIAYEYLVLGRQPRMEKARTTHRWLCLALDFRAYRELASRGELSFAGWLASLLAPKVCDLWAWRDPAPFVFSFFSKLKRIPSVTRRAFRWLSTAS